MKNKLYELYINNPEEFSKLVELFRNTFSYDEVTGYLTRKGKIVGTDNGKGYLRASLNSKLYLVHLIAYAIKTGEMAEVVDHKDLVKNNNSWENLRPTNKSGNERNTLARANSTTGVKNVYFIKEKNKFRVQFKIGGVTKYFGYYSTLEEATVVADIKRKELHGEFARG